MHWIILVFLIPYIYILLKVYRNLNRIKPFSGSDYPAAFVSVIAACRNEAANLPDLLGNLASQDYPGELFEVIIVDDNSGDSTYKIARDFKGLQRVMVIRNSGTGKKAAIRTGIRNASGEVIITVDADSRMGSSWLRTIASFYGREKPGMIICPVKLSGGKGFFRRFQELEFLSLQGITAGTAVAGDPVMCNGANLCFTKKLYGENSAFLHDELISGDDIFLLHSIKKNPQAKILWLESGNAMVSTGSSPTIALFLKQRSRWISKTTAYKDKPTIILALAILAAVILQLTTLTAGIFSKEFLILFAAVFFIKSVPDYLILHNTTTRYGNRSLMRLFFISQLIYPFYVLGVIIAAILWRNRGS